MTVSATIKGGDKIGPRLRALLTASGSTLKTANKKNASEFAALVRQAVPQDPKARHGHLIDTLTESDVGEYGAEVSIGSSAEPYPAHLEWGHRARDGSHVPAKPFWFTSLRVTKKRARDRTLRAERAAIKTAIGSGVG